MTVKMATGNIKAVVEHKTLPVTIIAKNNKLEGKKKIEQTVNSISIRNNYITSITTASFST